LDSVQVAEVVAESKDPCGDHLITVPLEADLLSVVEMLAKNKVCVAPVLSKQTQGDGAGTDEFVGVIGLMDIAALLLSKVTKSMQTNYILHYCREECERTTVRDLLTWDTTGRNGWHTISSTSSMKALLDLLCQPRVHRIAVMSPKPGRGKASSVVAILNHLHVAKFLNSHWKELSSHLPGLVEKVADLNLAPGGALSDDNNLSYLVTAFRNTWHREAAGDLHSHGVSFADKFINWIVQITLADIPPADCVASINNEDSIEAVLKYMCQQQVQLACVSVRGGEQNQHTIIGSLHLRHLFKDISSTQRNIKTDGDDSSLFVQPYFPPRRH